MQKTKKRRRKTEERHLQLLIIQLIKRYLLKQRLLVNKLTDENKILQIFLQNYAILLSLLLLQSRKI